jgi:hypothetical protein
MLQFSGSAYGYTGNNPVNFIDPAGLLWNPVNTVKDHWRGIAQAAVVTVAGAGVVACTLATAGICGGVVATTLITTGIGAAAGAGVYQLADTCHTAQGYVTSASAGASAAGVLSGASAGVRAAVGAWKSAGAANSGIRALPSGPKITAQWGADTYRHGGLMSTIEHINNRHAYNSGFQGVSRYAQGTSARDIKGYVDYVLRNGTVTGRGMIGNIGRTIGYDRTGNPVSGLEIIVRDGMIKTAYPVGVP